MVELLDVSDPGQRTTSVATAIAVTKSVISRLKKGSESGNTEHADVRGRSITRKEYRYASLAEKFYSWSEMCGHSRICENAIPAIQ